MTYVEKVAREAIQKRLGSSYFRDAVLAATAGSVDVNSGGNALAAQYAFQALGFRVMTQSLDYGERLTIEGPCGNCVECGGPMRMVRPGYATGSMSTIKCYECANEEWV